MTADRSTTLIFQFQRHGDLLARQALSRAAIVGGCLGLPRSRVCVRGQHFLLRGQPVVQVGAECTPALAVAVICPHLDFLSERVRVHRARNDRCRILCVSVPLFRRFLLVGHVYSPLQRVSLPRRIRGKPCASSHGNEHSRILRCCAPALWLAPNNWLFSDRHRESPRDIRQPRPARTVRPPTGSGDHSHGRDLPQGIVLALARNERS